MLLIAETILFSFTRLEDITASSNLLKHVPKSLFNIKRLRHLNLVNNEIISLLDDVTEQFDVDDVMHDDVIWQCHSLKSLNLGRNQLTSIPSAIHAANSLEKLHLCGNKLTSFPMGWKCPLVSKRELYFITFLCFLFLLALMKIQAYRLKAFAILKNMAFLKSKTYIIPSCKNAKNL